MTSHAFVTRSMRRRSDTTCILGIERQGTDMSVSLGVRLNVEAICEGGDTTPCFLQNLSIGCVLFQSIRLRNNSRFSAAWALPIALSLDTWLSFAAVVAPHGVARPSIRSCVSRHEYGSVAFGTNRISVRRRLSCGSSPQPCLIHVACLHATHSFQTSSACFIQIQQQPPFLALFAPPQLDGLESSQASVVAVAPHPPPHHCRPLSASVCPLSPTISP